MWDFLHLCVTESLVAVFESGDALSSVSHVLSAVASAAKSTASLTSDIIPSKAAETVKILGGLLPSAVSENEVEEESVKNDICLACEAWTRKNLEESDSVSDNAVVYLLKRCLGSRGTVRKNQSAHNNLTFFHCCLVFMKLRFLSAFTYRKAM